MPQRRLAALVAGLAGLVSSACTEPAAPEPGSVRSITILSPATTLRPGRTILVVAAPRDIRGQVIEVPVTWRSLAPDLLTVTPTGAVTALAPGRGELRATVGGVSATLELVLENPPATTLVVPDDTLRLELPGEGAVVPVRAYDADAEEVIGAPFLWESEAPRIATVDATGRVIPRAIGVTRVRVSLDGVRATRIVRVAAAPSAAAPIITQVTTAAIIPGQPFTLRGAQFGATVAANAVVVDGFPTTVTAASPSAITAVFPAAGVPCLPTAMVSVQVTTTGGVGATPVMLQAAPQRALAVGEALFLSTPAELACNELVDGAGRYLVALPNAARALGSGPIELTLQGGGGIADGAAAYATPPPHVLAHRPDDVYAPGDSRAQTLAHARLRAHTRILSGGIARATAQRGAHALPPRTALGPSLQIPPVDAITAVRVPDLGSNNFCQQFAPIGARTVYDGTRIVILEDTATVHEGRPTTARRVDAQLVALGAEVDAVMVPVAQRFGDPLVMDARLDANGRIVLVVTPRMNTMLAGALLGAVVTCDFFPRTQLASSNVGEVMYLQAPERETLGFTPGSLDRWRWEIRGTIAHELKHIVSFAERIVRGQPLEEPWLEEATARHAEELYLRSLTGLTATAFAGFTALACDVRAPLGDPACAHLPRVMLPHVEGLWDFLQTPAARSPLGPAASGDFSFYGSGWSLLRWAMDHATLSEGDITAQLTTSGQSGVTNLEARAGRNWGDLLSRWALATMRANVGGLATPAAGDRFKSWDFADVFAGLCAALTPCDDIGTARFRRPAALRPLRRGAPAFVLNVPEIQPGGFAAVDLTPLPHGSRRLLQVRGAGGGAIPSTARLAILRVE